MNDSKKYIVLDALGNPLARSSDEANPYLFLSLIDAVTFANEELKKQDAIAIAEIKILERRGSGM